MPCFKHFCCGYGLRSGGSFIGYYSIATYVKLIILCIVYLCFIKSRIDETEGVESFFNQVTYFLRVRSSNRDIEESVRELKSEN